MTGFRSRELDWTRPYGIPFDRTLLPVDDEITDTAAWLAGRFDALHTQQFTLNNEAAT